MRTKATWFRQWRALLMLSALMLGAGGCESVSEAMDSWVGHDVSEVIASWGPPQQVVDLGGGRRLFVWATKRSYVTPGSSTTTTTGNVYGYGNQAYGTANSTTTYSPGRDYSYQATRSFWVDASGRVYKWAWQGL